MLWLGYVLSNHLSALHADFIHILLARGAVTNRGKPIGILFFAHLGAPVHIGLQGKFVVELMMLQEDGVLHPALQESRRVVELAILPGEWALGY
jgi:hypothetical protein